MEKNPLEEMANKYRHLRLLEKKYTADDLNRLETHKNIVKLLEELKVSLEKFNEEFTEEYGEWKYNAIANRKFIQITDNESFLNIICTAANISKPAYAIKKIKVIDFVEAEGSNKQLVTFGTVSILSDYQTLSMLGNNDNPVYYNLIIEALNRLSKAGKSFIISTNITKEYDGEYLKEKIASLDVKDIIVSVNRGDYLDECINKFAMYATKYGSDFNEKKPNAVANLINYQPVKARKLINKNYITYYDKEEE